jgi:hypothetical protein
MKIKILFLSIFFVLFSQLSFSNQLYAIYNIDTDTVNNLKVKWYILSDIYANIETCNTNKDLYNQTISYYRRSDCFEYNSNYYYIKCDISDNCLLNNILNWKNNSWINYTDTISNNNNLNTTFKNPDTISDYQYYFTPIYLIRTFNKFTEKYYLKTSTLTSNDSVITHNWEKIDWKVVLSKLFTNGTKPIYQSSNGADWYISYQNVGNMIWYAWELPGDWRIAIYNCIKWADELFLSYDKSCEWHKKYNNEIFYLYPYEDKTSNNPEFTANSYLTLKNDLTIIAKTNVAKENISFCIQWNKCIKLSKRWEEYYVFGINKVAWYKITIEWLPAKKYTWYFKYINKNWQVSRSNYFTEIVDNSIFWNITNIWDNKVHISFAIPEKIFPKFYINFNWWNYNLINEWWNIVKNNWLNTYSQNISWLIRWVYESYVVYWSKRLKLNTITIN